MVNDQGLINLHQQKIIDRHHEIDEQDHKDISYCLIFGLLPENVLTPNQMIMKKSDQIKILQDKLIRNTKGLQELIHHKNYHIKE